MGASSQMPALRRLGNALFALLLGHLSQRRVRDVASGMRVLRREALARLLPLPDGLHFTPAMSARALMDGELRIVEIEMPYAERVGQSKLKVVRDGFRFLGVITNAAAFVRVSRLTLPLIVLLLGVAAAVMAAPTAFYLAHSRLEEWMFYRFALAGMRGSEAHDEIHRDDQGLYRETNRAGGIEAGISNGEEIVVRAGMKPLPTLMKPLRSVDLETGEPAEALVERSDTAAIEALAVVAEAAVAFELARAALEKFGGDALGDFVGAYNAYRERIDWQPR